MTSTSTSLGTAATERRSRGHLRRLLDELLHHKLGAVGFVVVVVIMLSAIFAPLIAPFDPSEIHYDAVLSPPSARYWFGTDELGRDILSRVIYGSRVSLEIVAVSIGAAMVIGSAIGLVSGYFGGWVDRVVMRVMDGMLAFPVLVLALAIVAALGPDLFNAMLAIAIVNVPNFARLTRGQVLSVRGLDYVQAATALGASHVRVMARHVGLNVADNIIVYASLRASTALITESSLSFLGLGAQPPTPTWGSMLATGMEYFDWPWMGIFPGLAIFVSVLSLNFIGDGLRDTLDSRLYER